MIEREGEKQSDREREREKKTGDRKQVIETGGRDNLTTCQCFHSPMLIFLFVP